MEHLREALELIATLSDKSHSWRSILAAIFSITCSLLFINHLFAVYDYLHNLRHPVGTIIFWLSAYTVYGLIRKLIDALADILAKHRASRRIAQQNSQNLAALENNLLHLSKKEIALLKFLLLTYPQNVWLPQDFSYVVSLTAKNIISCVDPLASKIVDLPHGSSINSLCSLYSLSPEARKIICRNSLLESSKWKDIAPDNSFAEFQD